jgi:cell division initiation protein
MRGLDADEVYAFLATVADEYEAAMNDNKALRERLLELDDKVQEYRNMEKTLRDTLLTAERVTVEAKDNARREAELIIKQAELDADKGVRDIKASATRLRQEIKALKNQRESYLARMKMLADSHLKFIETAGRDFDEDEQLLDMGRKDESRETRTPGTDTTAALGGGRTAASTLPADKPMDKTARPAETARSRETSPPAETTGSTEAMPPVPPGATPPINPQLRESYPGPGTDGTRTDAEASSSSVGTMTENDAGTRLNELLDRVVQQQAAVQTETVMPAETAMAVEQPVPDAGVSSGDDLAGTPTAAGDDLAGAPIAENVAGSIETDDADGEGLDEWSLERLKYDILSQRTGQDETP